MKIFLLFTLFYCNFVYAKRFCSISFGNEISANVDSHRIFAEIEKNKGLLLRKGYHLRSILDEGEPTLHGDILYSPNLLQMSIILHSMNHPSVHRYTTNNSDRSIAVKILLNHLPVCR